MSWGGLNKALTAWRNAINLRFPSRGTGSDGGYADAVHGSTSQHQPDSDGTVDAFDMDANLLASGIEAGSPLERRLIETLKLDFERDPRSQLWIHQREIANADVDDWREREYTGESPHDKHAHWQSRQSREDDGSPWLMPHTDALLRELSEKADEMDVSEFRTALRAEFKNGMPVRESVEQASVSYAGGPLEEGVSLGHVFQEILENSRAAGERLTAIEARLTALEPATPSQ